VLLEFYPTFLAVFTGRFALEISSPEARAVLGKAPTPAAATKLSTARIAAALRRAFRGLQRRRSWTSELWLLEFHVHARLADLHFESRSQLVSTARILTFMSTRSGCKNNVSPCSGHPRDTLTCRFVTC